MKTLLLGFLAFGTLWLYTKEDFDKMRILVGNWKAVSGNKVILERWNTKDDATLIGGSFIVSGSDTVATEEVRLFFEHGDIIYSPKAIGQNDDKEVPFSLTQVTGNSYTFENLKHDFPQRIVYDFVTSDSLHAYIEGVINHKTKRIDFYYTRQ